MIPDSDLKIERIRGAGPGGQRKNKVATCVRLTHIPSSRTKLALAARRDRGLPLGAEIEACRN